MAVDAPRATFSSTHSLYDYDLVLWDPLRSMKPYLTRGYGAGSYNGFAQLSQDNSPRLRDDLARRKADFTEFIELGRTLVVFLPGDLRVYIDSGKREYSGTGRNRQATTIVSQINIMNALPIKIDRRVAWGTELQAAHNSIGPLYRQTSDYWSYACVIESPENLQPLLRVRGTPKVVAAQASFEGGGSLIVLPTLHTGSADDDEDEDDEDDEDDYEGEDDDEEGDAEAGDELPVEEGDGDEADNVATSADEDDETEAVDKLVVEWLLAFTNSEEVSWPEWTDQYQFQTEVDRAPEISRRQEALNELQDQLDQLRSEEDIDRRWKLLVVASGTPFEEAVASALTQLGFTLQATIPGRTDLRGTHRTASVVVETKGVTKSAAEGHCAQLEKWVAEDLAEGRQSKGILVINAWLGDPPLQRTQPAFPSQMRPYAEMRNHCLVTGLQLLNLARTALAEPERTDELAALLLNTTGVLEGWDDPAQAFAVTPVQRRRRKSTEKGAET